MIDISSSQKKSKESENKKGKILVTCALPYVNNIPHIGNIVGSHLPGDIFARLCRLAGYDVVFIGGSDEHGTPIEVAAQQVGISPGELCDFYYKIHKEIYGWLNISYDNFSRTSLQIHHETTQEFFRKIHENGYIKEGAIKMPYCERDKRFLPDRYVIGVCPKCGYESARGDQCERCSSLLDPAELIEMRCAICGEKPVIKESRHLFLDLPKLQPKIEAWIESKKGEWNEQVIALTKGMLSEGLRERSITRDIKWGVKVPLKGYEDKVFYVWFDAPIGYISSTKEWDKEKWKSYWLEKDAKIIHFIGKDNIPFHTIFWPGILIARGEYNMPYRVAGLQYLNYEGSKISKSKGFGVFCENLPSSGIASDIWRFYLTFLIPENSDTEWKWKEFQDRVNNELVANLGNFIYRTLSFINANFSSKVPDFPEGKIGNEEKEIFEQAEKTAKEVEELILEVRIRDALKKVLELSDLGNRYFQKNEPWKLIKGSEEEKSKCAAVLFTCANLCHDLAILMHPFLPESSLKICSTFSKPLLKLSDAGKQNIERNTKINKPEILFSKIDDKKLEEIKQKATKVTSFEDMLKKEERKEQEESTEKSGRQMITYDYFSKLELRIAKIISAERVKGSNKLVKLKIDLGEQGQRQIVAGIGKNYSPEELVGKKIVVIANLEPAKLMGEVSEGMLLAATDNDNVVVLMPEKEVREGVKVS